MEPLDAALALVARINAHDVDGIALLLSSDHRFVDSLGAVVQGRENVRIGWSLYLTMVPDYRIDVTRFFWEGAEVVLLGTASGTYGRHGILNPEDAWHTPAAWRVVVVDGHIAEWQVYADNEPIRRRMAPPFAKMSDAS